MAERRMFAKTIIDSDAFIDMPVTARLLYYDLAMRADDDGFVNSPKKIMRMVGASQDDLAILISKKFIIPFDSGIVVIKHWRIHNYIRKDTYHETTYREEKRLLTLDEKNAYTLQVRDESVDGTLTQVRLGKVRKGKNIKIPPTLEEVTAYCNERHNNIDPQTFIDFYESKGWYVGKNKMKDWKACIRTWERSDRKHHVVMDAPQYIIDQMNGNIEETPATDDEIAAIKRLQEKL